jgi:UDP-N-acetylglucosamine 4-epimerase
MQLMNHETITINGDGNYSRDFTYIENVIQMNELAMTTENSAALNTVYNTAFGDRNTLNDLVNYLKEYLAKYDPAIADAEVAYGPNRVGDIPHLWLVSKAKELLIIRNSPTARVERSDRLVLE